MNSKMARRLLRLNQITMQYEYDRCTNLETTVTRDAKIKENMQCISIGWMDKTEENQIIIQCLRYVWVLY